MHPQIRVVASVDLQDVAKRGRALGIDFLKLTNEGKRGTEVTLEAEHLLVGLVSIERYNRDAIVNVKCKGVNRVVDNNDLRQIELLLFENSQVFNVMTA